MIQINPQNHPSELQHVDRVEATCTKEGCIEHYHCDQCKKDFDNENGTNEIDAVIPINPQNHPSKLQHIDRVEATCTEEGSIEHYHCDQCEKNFDDANGTNEIVDIVIPTNSNNHNLSLEDGKAHCDRCKQDFSGFISINNDTPILLTKEDGKYFLKTDDGFTLKDAVSYLAPVGFTVMGNLTYTRTQGLE